MKTVKAFLLGLTEFRNDFTSNCGADAKAYDWGREIAHRLTLRRFDSDC